MDYQPVLEKIKRTLVKVDPESHQITSGDSWSPMVFRGERYWLRYDVRKLDAIVLPDGRNRLKFECQHENASPPMRPVYAGFHLRRLATQPSRIRA